MKSSKPATYIQPDARGRIQLPKELRAYRLFKLEEKGLRFELIPLKVEEEPSSVPQEIWLQPEVEKFFSEILFPKLSQILAEEKPEEVLALFLYGSRARGDALSRSDFDFGILCKEIPSLSKRSEICDRFQSWLQEEFQLLKSHGVLGEPSFHFFSCDPKAEDVSPIYFSISKDGQLIWDKFKVWPKFLETMAAIEKKLKVRFDGVGRTRKWTWQNKN
ncbi:MAG: nucleotidyltransferase domain-containing protein [Pseudomonadota bacterium]